MMNMSRVLNCDVTENCKPWRAPGLGDNRGNSYDFKSPDSNNPRNEYQQDKIRQQSYEKSFAKGYMEGLAKGQQEIGEQVSKLHSILAALTMPLPDLDNQVVDELVQLCIAVVKQMIRRELKTSPDEIVAVVREALNLLPTTPAEIILELHPEDVMIIQSALAKPEIKSSWTIVEDPFLTRGGCRVITGKSRIDATVEKRIDTVIAELIGTDRKSDRST